MRINQKAESPRLFNAIARRYDLLNYVLSFGMDIHWRKMIAQHLSGGNDLRVLDVATGTADVAIILARQNPWIREVVGVDLAEEMLKIGRQKIEKAGFASKIVLKVADAQQLPFPDGSFDAVTVSFGLRNVPDLMKGLIEAYRVLKPDGRLIVLEFAKPQVPVLRHVHGFYLHGMMPVIGGLLTGNYEAYKYLSRTVGEFPCGERFGKIIKQVGFKDVRIRKIFFGVAVIYEAQK